MDLIKQVRHRIVRPQLMLQEHGVCKVPRLLTIHLTGDQDHDVAKVIVLNKVLQESNILVILGNRQSGKTWLLNQLTLKSKGVFVCYFYNYMLDANDNFYNFRDLVDPDKKYKKQKGILYLPNDVRVQMLTLESRGIKSGFAPNYIFFEDIELQDEEDRDLMIHLGELGATMICTTSDSEIFEQFVNKLNENDLKYQEVRLYGLNQIKEDANTLHRRNEQRRPS